MSEEQIKKQSQLDSLAGDYQAIADRFKEGIRGKVAIVTGGNSGLGRETATALLACGCRVFLATRDPQKGQKAAEDLANEPTTQAEVEFMHLELTSLKSVQSFAEEFRKKNLPLHILHCNGSPWMVPETQNPTEDGFEVQTGAYFFGHVYLIELLKDKLQSSAPSRIVWTTSASETMGRVVWEDLGRVNDSSNVYSYGDSKLYAQMVSRVYAKQLEASGVHVFQGQPGQTSTNFFSATKFSWLKPGATGQYLTQALIGLKPEQGALPIIYSSIAPEQDLESAFSGLSMGPEYHSSLGGLVSNITNTGGLIRYQEPQHDSIKDYDQCVKLYQKTLDILNSKPVVQKGPSILSDTSLAADKAKDTVKSAVKTVTGA